MSINWTNIFNKHKGQWVALDTDEQTVLGVGRTAKEALAKAKENGYQSPILTHMPEEIVSFVGSL